MKNWKKIIGMAITSTIACSAFAGEKAGNGGGAQVCYTDASLTIERSIESYDLYFARSILKRKIQPWDGTEAKQDVLKRVLKKVELQSPDLAANLSLVLARMEEPNFINDDPNIQVTFVPGSVYPQLDDNCKYKQMVNWYDPGQLYTSSGNIVLRDNSHYESGGTHMDPLSQAGLDFHEAAYKVARFYMGEEAQVKDVVAFVASAFSDGKIIPPFPTEKLGFQVRENIAETLTNIDLVRPANCKPGESYRVEYLSGYPRQSYATFDTFNLQDRVHYFPFAEIMTAPLDQTLMIGRYDGSKASKPSSIRISVCGKSQVFSVDSFMKMIFRIQKGVADSLE